MTSPPRGGRLVATSTGVVEAPVHMVAETAIARLGAHADPYTHRFLDPDRRWYVLQGHWWYRGVYSFEPHDRGTLIIYRAYNIARRGRFLVRLILLQYRLGGTLTLVTDGGVADLMTGVGEDLGCRAYRP